MPKQRTKRWLSLLVMFVIASAVFIDMAPYFQYRRFHNEITELAPVGSNWQEARKRIEAQGYIVDTPFTPIGRRDNVAFVTDPDIRRCPLIIRVLRIMRSDVRFGIVVIGFDDVNPKVLEVNY